MELPYSTVSPKKTNQKHSVWQNHIKQTNVTNPTETNSKGAMQEVHIECDKNVHVKLISTVCWGTGMAGVPLHLGCCMGWRGPGRIVLRLVRAICTKGVAACTWGDPEACLGGGGGGEGTVHARNVIIRWGQCCVMDRGVSPVRPQGHGACHIPSVRRLAWLLSSWCSFRFFVGGFWWSCWALMCVVITLEEWCVLPQMLVAVKHISCQSHPLWWYAGYNWCISTTMPVRSYLMGQLPIMSCMYAWSSTLSGLSRWVCSLHFSRSQ